MTSTSRDEHEAADFVESFASVMTDSGMPRMSSRIFAYLLSTDSGAAAAGELAEALRASPAAISGAVRYLLHVQLVVRHRVPGERKDTFRLAHDLWYAGLATDQRMLIRWATVSRQGAEVLGADTPAGFRLEETARFFDFLREEFVGVMERWKERQG